MISIGIGIPFGRRGGGFTPEYKAILAYATAQGYTLPSAGQQVKQNKLILDLKAAGIWNLLDTFAVFATDGNTDFSLIDWKRLSQYTAVNSPTFTANQGLKGNGTSSFINSNFNPVTNGVNYTLNSASFGVFSFDFNNNDFISGVSGSAANCLRMSAGSANQRINMGIGTLVPSVDLGVNTRKLRVLNRVNSNDVVAFENTIVTSHTGASTSLENSQQLVLRTGSFYSITTASMFFMGANLSTKNTELNNAFFNYMNSI